MHEYYSSGPCIEGGNVHEIQDVIDAEIPLVAPPFTKHLEVELA